MPFPSDEYPNSTDSSDDSVLIDDEAIPETDEDECEPTVPLLKIIDPSSVNTDNGGGTNPYDMKNRSAVSVQIYSQKRRLQERPEY